MALGASTRDILGLVVGKGLGLTAMGLLAGHGPGPGPGPLPGGLLYEVQATDPAVLAAAALGFCLVAVLASGLPALRAARTDPMRALRTE